MNPGLQNPPEANISRISTRLAWGFLIYLVIGSVALVLWFGHREESESRRAFVAVARSQAGFIREMSFPRSEKLARDVSKLIGMELYFWHKGESKTTPVMESATWKQFTTFAAPDEVFGLTNEREGLKLAMDAQTDIAFIRVKPAASNALARPATLAALGGFWLLSFALAWMVGREVVRPLVSFSRRLPDILTDQQTELPETSRTDEVGQLARAIISTRDQLTEERQKRERSERLALLGKVATGLAHEIKNPLASIRLHSQLAATTEQTAEAAESLKHIQNETQVIEGLVNQWLYLARPEPPKKTLVEIGGVLKDLASALKPQADHAGVVISLSLDEDMTVMADRQRLAQAFRNIMLNAIQHMPSGGKHQIAGVCGIGAMRIEFLDGGSGFSDAALQKGAELFFSEREGGMGLGLNVAQEIINAHGGRLELENDPPHGGCVHITLPLTPA